ncbi:MULTISPECIES: ethanolamine ammonia-lyase subunit EutC [Lysinibacillus]|uniref:Ethanolamine ammonia-lyase small subunit n=1 Tax=Lysinibacillus fusiformis TaxID=28031 RepID=A0A2I0V3B4_9BACI|nr:MULTISPECIES: ethanolamine ammonia-lyase subunit EutC [Lysinibacillus]PKU52778.1 ethanolamine ammonia-lyase subunit EutC [Lysinibacillus fusiformis]SCY59770.1 Ethanolamine ammonia-lyase light chain [Lysinibacillus sp. SG9]SDB26954.1 Ethanolamine ammonia-lyase light chain [Lysinibacillus sp. TC-37]SFS85940.1 Ethanolamine ammonia-lyase light chain [Lysinibacillus sp. SG55]
MNDQLVSMITQLVMEKMEKSTESQVPETVATPTEQPLITFYDTAAHQATETTTSRATSQEPLIQLYQHGAPQQATVAPTVTFEQPINVAVPIKPFQFEADTLTDSVQAAKKHTPARIGVGRAGTRPKTKTWLKFRLDHAAAVDAVYGEVSEGLLQKLDVFQVTTKVTDKEEYITRPDLGRRLSDESKALIQQKCKPQPKVQIIISNGLSASAIEENVQDVYLALQQSLSNLNIDIGTTFYIDKGRVALMDEIGELLQAEVIVYLIGERPGLVSAESMSAYLCYKPKIGTVEAERMVISNIHKGGIPPLEAGAYLGTIVEKILHYQASGVELVAKEG